MAIEELEEFIETGSHLSRPGLENDLTLISPASSTIFLKKIERLKKHYIEFFQK